MSPKFCRRFCKYGKAGPMMKRIRRENGVWNGQSKESVDAVVMKMSKRNPKAVNQMTTDETERLTSQRYCESPNPRRNGAH